MIFKKPSMLLSLCLVGLAGIGTIVPSALPQGKRVASRSADMQALLIKPAVAARVRRK